MARYAIEFTPRALRDLGALSSDVALRLLSKIDELAENPVPRGDTVKRLESYNPPRYRLRMGDWRAVFRVDGDVIVITLVVHRSELGRALRTLR